MPTKTKASATTATGTCDGCWGTPELRPSGKTFVRHPAGDGSNCPGHPVHPVMGGDKIVITCPECGKEGAPLKTNAERMAKHEAEGEVCLQRPGVKAKCPTCGRRVGLVKALLANHKDQKTNTKCTHAGRSPVEKPLALYPNARQGKETKPPAPKKAPQPKGIDAAFAKASIFGQTIKSAGWATEVLVDKDSLSAVARSTRGDETITIMWEEARCVGGTIFHTFRTRKIALRNKNAAVQRALLTPEQVLAEHSRVTHRARVAPKTAKGPKRTASRPDDEMQALRAVLPFDPSTATDAEIARGIVNKTLTWRNRIADKEETGLVNPNYRAVKVNNAKADGSRQVTFFMVSGGAKTIRLADLVSVA
jgi:endogenous inhibitor of DNA gyrase (YacG/DUF329 family)